jgi:hypothetical protein
MESSMRQEVAISTLRLPVALSDKIKVMRHRDRVGSYHAYLIELLTEAVERRYPIIQASE